VERPFLPGLVCMKLNFVGFPKGVEMLIERSHFVICFEWGAALFDIYAI